MTFSDISHSCTAEVITSSRVVASINVILASARRRSRRKDPGREDQRLEPRSEESGEWEQICGAVTRRGRKKDSVSRQKNSRGGRRDTSADGSQE